MGRLQAFWDALGESAWAVIITLAIIGATAFIVNLHGTFKAEAWMACLETAGCAQVAPPAAKPSAPVVPIITAIPAASAPAADAAVTMARLNHQLEHIRHRADYHLKITRDFYISYYYALTMALFLGAAAAILLFFISQKGWSQAKSWQAASFIITTSAAASYGAFPTLYTQQDNIEQNKELYLHHRALENEMLSFAVTGEPLDRSKLGLGDNEAVTAAIFVRYVDRRMIELHKLPLGFDYSRLPADYLAGVPAEVKPAPGPLRTPARPAGEAQKEAPVVKTAR